MKIKEVIVVEGRHDSATLKQYFDCDTIETHGSALSKEILNYIALVKEQRGIIIFTDPDYPGEKIRTTINQKIPGCLNAYIDKHKARTSKKVGIEHASKQDLLDALEHLFTYQESDEVSLTRQEFYELGLEGCDLAALKRAKLAKKLYLGKPNAKTLWKRLNMLAYRKEDIERLMQEGEQ